jgi:hypothetical protein
LETAKRREWEAEHPTTITGGNVNIPVPVYSNTVKAVSKKQIPQEFIEHQFVVTAPRLDDNRIRRGMKRFCNRQLTWLSHPELGKPEGDYKETTWLNEYTRRELKVFTGILEFNRGIARKTKAKNSTYTTIDPEVLKMGVRGSYLPHPKECDCDECKPKSE